MMFPGDAQRFWQPRKYQPSLERFIAMMEARAKAEERFRERLKTDSDTAMARILKSPAP